MDIKLNHEGELMSNVCNISEERLPEVTNSILKAFQGNLSRNGKYVEVGKPSEVLESAIAEAKNIEEAIFMAYEIGRNVNSMRHED